MRQQTFFFVSQRQSGGLKEPILCVIIISHKDVKFIAPDAPVVAFVVDAVVVVVVVVVDVVVVVVVAAVVVVVVVLVVVVVVVVVVDSQAEL